MTQPNGSNPVAKPVAPPPSPKVQALSTALELAKIRGTAGVPSQRVTTVEQLISDAQKIADFIGAAPPRNSMPPTVYDSPLTTLKSSNA